MTPRSAMAAKGAKSKGKGKGRGKSKGHTNSPNRKGGGKRAKGETQCKNETSYGTCTRQGCQFMHKQAGRSPRVPGTAAPGTWTTLDPLGRRRSNTPRTPRGTRKSCTHWKTNNCKHMRSPSKCKWKHSNSKGRSPRTGSGKRNISKSGASRRYSRGGKTRLKAKSRSPSAGRRGTGSAGPACATTGLIAADKIPATLPQEPSGQSDR